MPLKSKLIGVLIGALREETQTFLRIAAEISHRGLGLDESEFTKSVLFFILYFIRPYNIRE